MAHEFETGFFYREPAWHGLGNVLAERPKTWAEAREAGGFTWDPKLVPSFGYSGIHIPTGRQVYEPGPDVVGDFTQSTAFQRCVRSDTGLELSHPRESWTLIDHTEMGEIVEAFLGLANVEYETGGVLEEGRAVWVLIKLNEPIALPGDNSLTLPYFLIRNRHDGQGSCSVSHTAVRVVCANTWKLSEMRDEANGTVFSFRHNDKWRDRLEEAKEAIKGVRKEFTTYQEIAQRLLGMTVTPRQQQMFVNEFIPNPTGATSDRQLENLAVARGQIRDILASPTTAPVAHTAYGLVQAASEWDEHVRRSKTPETRFARSVVKTNESRQRAIRIAELVTAG
ncbi:DUF932 domain-containing protein [Frankia sp. AvcI1]|uniref:DUF932 domain-containing protein n=1 Tax=Frankia sp. AvcI1 TaxID=573496 RepID=UPI002118F322|nr:DUF932 domain-containing protein [Frankia sp. AvcI1]